MCREGGCGCCIVTLHGLHPVTRQLSSWSVNSCLFPIYSCHGLHIVTAEGLKTDNHGPHILQRHLASSFGTQCGYCSPGFIMTMYGLLEARNYSVTMREVEDVLGGNLCRCTGYRPILDAFKSFAIDAPGTVADIEDLPKSCSIGRNVCFETCYSEIHLCLSYGELRTISVDTVLQIGANVPLTEVICELRKASETRSDFFYCRQIAKHIEQIAHPAVRNVGTIGGNLSIKHQHNEFVSDIYILLEAIGATLTIISFGGSIRIVSIADYMKINMKNRIIVKITLPSLPKKQYEFFSYKITLRAQNTLALVNCAFLFKFNADHSLVLNAKLCFGGLNPHFTHATCTENFLMNQNLFKDSTIQAACLSLEKELVLDWVLPAPCPEYRKMVAIGLFYKAVVGICPSDRVRPEIRSVGQDIERMLSCGEQHFSDSHIHKPVIKLEAIGQCTGDAKYTNDMPYMPNEVWGA
uniref:Uncharacterized protein n=1 Tax=Phlebotomus papatasi TaxID=29031 RepID=A0A1B0DQ09_PHLPP